MERMRARQGRPRRARRPPGELTSRWWQAQRANDDEPPGTFYLERDFVQPKRPPRPWEEADFVRWCLMEDGTSYEDADAELRDVTALLTPQQARQGPTPAAAACEASAAVSDPAATAPQPPGADQVPPRSTRRATPDGSATSRPDLAA